MHEVAFPDRAPARARKAATGKAKPRRAASSAPRGGLWRRARLPALTSVATAGLAAILAGIVLNALVLQKGHHPAPLFSPEVAAAPPAIRPARPPQPVASLPAPAADRPVDPAPDTVLPKATAPVPRDQPSAHAGAARSRDRIAQLLDGTLDAAGRSGAGEHPKLVQPSTHQGHHSVASAKPAGTARSPKAREAQSAEMKTDLARAGQPFAAAH